MQPPRRKNTSDSKRKRSSLDRKMSKAIRSAVDKSTTKETRNRQRANLRMFIEFCAENDIHRKEVFPSSEKLLCFFASSFKGRLSGKTVRRRIGAIKAWHARQKMPWHGGDLLKKVLKGVDKATPASSVKEQRPGVKRKWLVYLQEDLDMSIPKNKAVLATADTALYSQLRLGEILSDKKSIEKYDFTSLPAVKHFRDSPENETKLLFLPKTKSEPLGVDVVVPHQSNSTNPIKATEEHIRANKLERKHPLFAYRDEKGKLVALTRKEFLKVCNQVWKKRGLPRITGHCFRIGGTTHYLLHGVPPDVVKRFGRWKSDAFLRYWRSLDKLAASYLENQHGAGWVNKVTFARPKKSPRRS